MKSLPPTPSQIRAIRQAAELTQRDLSRLLGVTRMTMYNYEQGRTAMRPEMYDYMIIRLTAAADPAAADADPADEA